jgi:hypothetical protein
MKMSFPVSRRTFLAGGLVTVAEGLRAQPFLPGKAPKSDETSTRSNELYNGIRLPSAWPPKYELDYSPMPALPQQSSAGNPD